jgi:8-oxo-dGTP pyrophosphatase MutT (NUDIX family)
MMDAHAPASANQIAPKRAMVDAATLILIDRSDRVPKVLLGRRHQGHTFMPGKFVFPGGGVDPTDRLMPVASPLDARAESRLMSRVVRPSRLKARALALAAIRETFEETGLLIGSRRENPPKTPGGPWAAFAEAKIHPELAGMHFIARAVTPPRLPRRYDTRFFTVDAEAVAHRVEGVVGPDAELVELVWLPIAETVRLDLATITGVVLRALDLRIRAGLDHDEPVPYYYMARGSFRRDLL